MTSVEGILPPPPDDSSNELEAAPDPKDPSPDQTVVETPSPSVPSADPTETVSTTQVVPTQETTDTQSTGTEKDNDNPLGSDTLDTSGTPIPAVSSIDPVKAEYDRLTDVLFSRLAPVGVGDTLKIMLYGPPGGTKSTTLNIDNCLIYNNDGGLSSILAWHEKSGMPLANNCLALPFTTFTQASMLIERLRNKDNIPQVKDFEVFAIDTINKLADKILVENSKMRHARLPESQKGASSPFDPQTEDYVKTNNEMTDLVEQLLSLPMNLVLIAHSRSSESKKYGIKIYPDFSEKLANKVEAMMDVVAYVEMQEDNDGGKSPVFMFTTDGHTHAKNRLGLPDIASNVKYTDIHQRWTELKALQAAQ